MQSVRFPFPPLYWRVLCDLKIVVFISKLVQGVSVFCSFSIDRNRLRRKRLPMQNEMAIFPCPPMRRDRLRCEAMPSGPPSFPVADLYPFACQSGPTNGTRRIQSIHRARTLRQLRGPPLSGFQERFPVLPCHCGKAGRSCLDQASDGFRSGCMQSSYFPPSRCFCDCFAGHEKRRVC